MYRNLTIQKCSAVAILLMLCYSQLPLASAASDTSDTPFMQKEPDASTRLAHYDLSQLTSPVSANIQIDGNSSSAASQLIKFSSLSPDVLAFMSQSQGAPSMQRFRIIDSVGRIMPMSLRQVQKTQEVNHDVAIISVEADNPVAMEKLRQALRIKIEKLSQHDNPAQALKIELDELPSNIAQAQTPTQTRTWWLANPAAIASTTSEQQPTIDSAQSTQLRLNISQSSLASPVQLQLYGSDDLLSWQMINQSVVNPFKQSATRTSNTASQHLIELSDKDRQYRYWQLVASQPLTLGTVTTKQYQTIPNYFLTRANFTQQPNDTTHWQLNQPTPMWITGIDFFVPENQLWQVNIVKTGNDDKAMPMLTQAADSQPQGTLANGQVDSTNTRLTWTPTVIQNLALDGQMQADNIPVTLLTPIYELYFLAQGKAPYRLVLNDANVLSQPVIDLSNAQIKQLATNNEASEGQLSALQPLDNPNAKSEKYRQWLLWATLALILAALSWLAYRLYQQITTQTRVE